MSRQTQVYTGVRNLQP